MGVAQAGGGPRRPDDTPAALLQPVTEDEKTVESPPQWCEWHRCLQPMGQAAQAFCGGAHASRTVVPPTS